MNKVRIKELWDLDEGDVVLLDASVGSFEVKNSTKGSKFADIKLVDSDDEISCKMWNVSEVNSTFLLNNKFIRVNATINVFAGNKQLIINRLYSIPEDELDTSKLEKTAPESVESLVEYLEGCISEIEDEVIKTIVSRRWEKTKDKFVQWPAAKGHHHNYKTGLLYHTVSMLRLATNNLRQYPGKLDKDIMYGSITLHDMEKIKEYSGFDNPNITEIGELYGHIFMSGAETYFESKVLYSEKPDLDYSKVKYLIHAILAHHGKLEWGSPVTPKTMEAEIVHQIDMMDSRMNMKIKK